MTLVVGEKSGGWEEMDRQIKRLQSFDGMKICAANKTEWREEGQATFQSLPINNETSPRCWDIPWQTIPAPRACMMLNRNMDS